MITVQIFKFFFASCLIITIASPLRRIINGTKVESEKPYMVYIIEAKHCDGEYDEWMCGGAIVHPQYVLTSAACLEDVNHMYVIAGYNKYVPSEKIEVDPCTKNKKKKIVFVCVPKHHDFEYDHVTKWTDLDIALAKVESPYDFNDKSYKSVCSYTPQMIPINYEKKYQKPGTEVTVYGWGHEFKWRRPEDKGKYNSEFLKYSSTVIIKKKVCMEIYSNLSMIISKYMLCTQNKGNIDEHGNLISTSKPGTEGCDDQDSGECNGSTVIKINESSKSKSTVPYVIHKENTYVDKEELNFPKKLTETQKETQDKIKDFMLHFTPPIKLSKTEKLRNKTKYFRDEFRSWFYKDEEMSFHEWDKQTDLSPFVEYKDDVINVSKSLLLDESDKKQNLNEYDASSKISPLRISSLTEDKRTRRNGICQNDHGGPLVTWVGGREMVIGVASAFLVDESSSRCVGPFLFTSTNCNGAFLSCVLNSEDPDYRKKCSSPLKAKGFDIIARSISWKEYPTGSEENETIFERPQEPLDVQSRSVR